VLARAFADDPVMRWMLAESDDLTTALASFFRIAVACGTRRGHTYRSAGWEAVAYWTPPGADGMFDAVAGPEVGELVVGQIGLERARSRGELSALMAEHHYPDEHFYLPFVGVDPARQGRGHGVEVMRPVLDLCDHNRIPAYLESSNPRNIPFYERLGFEITSQFSATGGPTLTGMLRLPA
jgi:ribosomal protein S18 acetylase RimI-like enzyme